nr:unnamed protein product [Callosobruchus analis]
MDLDHAVIVGGKYQKRKTKREQAYKNRCVDLCFSVSKFMFQSLLFSKYRDKDPLLQNFHPPCQHRVGRFVCLSFARTILARAKRNIFFKQNRKKQDKLLSFLMDVKLPKRTRKKMRGSSKDCSVLGKRRLDTIAEGIQTGVGVIDKRGGDRKAARSKSKRLYLPSILSINKLFRIYNDSIDENVKVKKTFFAKIFFTKFNLGFGSPASDMCSYCHRTRSAIQSCEDGQEKQRLITYLAVHKAKTKAFHALMKETPYASVTYAFDLQQVQLYLN